MLTRRTKGIIAAGLLTTGLMTIPATSAWASGTKCSQNACEYVYNGTAGSDYIYYVDVWDPNSSASHTLRLLYNQTAVAAWYGPAYPGVRFEVNSYLPSGTCIQGGVEGVSNARTPCWYVP
jgi:hypothetical protein